MPNMFGESVLRSKHGIAMKTGDEGRQILVRAEVESQHRAVSGIMIKCLLMIFGYITFGWLWFNSQYDWSFTDCFYFAMVTVTTVGYGDLTPADLFWHQLFVGVYAFCGVAIIAAMVSDLAVVSIAAVEKMLEEAKRRSIEKSNELIAAAKKMKTSIDDLTHHKKSKKKSRLKRLKRYLQAMQMKYGKTPVALLLLTLQLCLTWEAGATLLQVNEGIPHTKAFYCAVITSISVGYGDVYPVTQLGMCFFGTRTFYHPRVSADAPNCPPFQAAFSLVCTYLSA
jgi:potassium channel subfamily K